MLYFAFLFEVMDKMPTVKYMYISGLILALLVFAAAYINRWIGFALMLLVTYSCTQEVETPDIIEAVIKEVGISYILHWTYSCRLTFFLSAVLFLLAIYLKSVVQKRKIGLQ